MLRVQLESHVLTQGSAVAPAVVRSRSGAPCPRPGTCQPPATTPRCHAGFIEGGGGLALQLVAIGITPDCSKEGRGPRLTGQTAATVSQSLPVQLDLAGNAPRDFNCDGTATKEQSRRRRPCQPVGASTERLVGAPRGAERRLGGPRRARATARVRRNASLEPGEGATPKEQLPCAHRSGFRGKGLREPQCDCNSQNSAAAPTPRGSRANPRNTCIRGDGAGWTSARQTMHWVGLRNPWNCRSLSR